MSPIIWLGALLVALWLLGNLLSRHIQGLVLLLTGRQRAATMVYDLLVLPGVVVHELSHVLVAMLLGIRVLRIDLFRFRAPGDARQGEVVVARADPLRMSLVGAAPLLGGMAALLSLVRWVDPPAVEPSLASLTEMRELVGQGSSALQLYLIFAIANTMFPSEADRKAWWVVGAALGVAAIALLAMGVRPEIPPRWLDILLVQSELLASALTPVVLVDLVCLAIVLAAEALTGKMRGRRVVYRSLK